MLAEGADDFYTSWRNTAKAVRTHYGVSSHVLGWGHSGEIFKLSSN